MRQVSQAKEDAVNERFALRYVAKSVAKKALKCAWYRTLLQIFDKGVFFMNKTLKLTYTAVLTAICALTNVFSVQLSGSNYLSFTYIPCFIAGIYLGILPGITVGLLGDVIGQLIHPMGAYNPLIGLSCILLGVIPAIVYRTLPLNRPLKLIVSIFLCAVICTSGLNTFALWVMYSASSGKTFWVYLGARLPFQLVMFAVNGVLLLAIQQSNIIDKLIAKSTQPKKQCNEEK